jgi:hypothetical protein
MNLAEIKMEFVPVTKDRWKLPGICDNYDSTAGIKRKYPQVLYYLPLTLSKSSIK